MSAGASSKTPLRELTALPRPSSRRGMEGRTRGGEGRGKGECRRDWKGENGEGRRRGEKGEKGEFFLWGGNSTLLVGGIDSPGHLMSDVDSCERLTFFSIATIVRILVVHALVMLIVWQKGVTLTKIHTQFPKVRFGRSDLF